MPLAILNTLGTYRIGHCTCCCACIKRYGSIISSKTCLWISTGQNIVQTSNNCGPNVPVGAASADSQQCITDAPKCSLFSAASRACDC